MLFDGHFLCFQQCVEYKQSSFLRNKSHLTNRFFNWHPAYHACDVPHFFRTVLEIFFLMAHKLNREKNKKPEIKFVHFFVESDCFNASNLRLVWVFHLPLVVDRFYRCTIGIFFLSQKVQHSYGIVIDWNIIYLEW